MEQEPGVILLPGAVRQQLHGYHAGLGVIHPAHAAVVTAAVHPGSTLTVLTYYEVVYTAGNPRGVVLAEIRVVH